MAVEGRVSIKDDGELAAVVLFLHSFDADHSAKVTCIRAKIAEFSPEWA